MPAVTTVLLVVAGPREVSNRPKWAGGEAAIISRVTVLWEHKVKIDFKVETKQNKMKKKDFHFLRL